MCDDALDYYADYGEPIDVDNDIGLEDLLIAMIFPLGISAFICLILYRRMKTARQKTEADEYMPGFTLRVKRDRYTHTTRERTYDPPQKESHSPAVRPSIPTASRLVGRLILKHKNKNTSLYDTARCFYFQGLSRGSRPSGGRR